MTDTTPTGTAEVIPITRVPRTKAKQPQPPPKPFLALCGVHLHQRDGSDICTCSTFRVAMGADGKRMFVCTQCRTAHDGEGFRWVEL